MSVLLLNTIIPYNIFECAGCETNILVYVKGRPCGSVAQLAECSHGKREALGSSPGRATIFSSPVTFGGSVWVRG